MEDNNFNRKIHNFFAEYIICNPVAVDDNRMLKDVAVQEAAKLLIDEGVFISIKDMKKQALKDYNIFLPSWIFEKVKEAEQEWWQEKMLNKL